MAVLANTGAGQTSGTQVTSTNSDDFGETAFTFVNNVVTYDNATVHSPAVNAFRFAPVSGANSVVQFGGAGGADLGANNVAVDMWCYFTALPTTEFTLLQASNTSASRRFGVNLDTAGKIKLRTEPSTFLWTSTTAIPTNAWFRLRIYSENGGTGTSLIKAQITDAAGTVLDSFTTSTATRTTTIASVTFGKYGTDTTAAVFRLSELKVDTAATDYVGTSPAVVPGWQLGSIAM